MHGKRRWVVIEIAKRNKPSCNNTIHITICKRKDKTNSSRRNASVGLCREKHSDRLDEMTTKTTNNVDELWVNRETLQSIKNIVQYNEDGAELTDMVEKENDKRYGDRLDRIKMILKNTAGSIHLNRVLMTLSKSAIEAALPSALIITIYQISRMI